MTKEELIARNRKFALDVLMTIEALPSNRVYDALVRQLVRSSTSIGANYRAACRAKSTKDFVNKLKIVEEEADESSYFLDLLKEIDKGKSKEKLDSLLSESNQLVSIYVASLKTMREKLKSKS
ncbi:MAG TPA: four helix bundle protein [Cyclobacteriaceae bacterium]